MLIHLSKDSSTVILTRMLVGIDFCSVKSKHEQLEGTSWCVPVLSGLGEYRFSDFSDHVNVILRLLFVRISLFK